MATLATSSRPNRKSSAGVKAATPAIANTSRAGPGSRVVHGSLVAFVLMSAGPPLSPAGNLRPSGVAMFVPFTGPPFHEVVRRKWMDFAGSRHVGGVQH